MTKSNSAELNASEDLILNYFLSAFSLEHLWVFIISIEVTRYGFFYYEFLIKVLLLAIHGRWSSIIGVERLQKGALFQSFLEQNLVFICLVKIILIWMVIIVA